MSEETYIKNPQPVEYHSHVLYPLVDGEYFVELDNGDVIYGKVNELLEYIDISYQLEQNISSIAPVEEGYSWNMK